MAELTSSSEKDPYMQAYITARMKNQVEDMKLHKILTSMEVSQRVKKIMMNLELFEDRKTAHRLQKEVMDVAKRQSSMQRRLIKRHETQNVTSRHQMTSAWTSSVMKPEHTHTLAQDFAAVTDLQYPHPHPQLHPPGDRAVYPVTAVKGFGSAGARECLPDLASGSSRDVVSGRQRQRTGRRTVADSIPLIQITDANEPVPIATAVPVVAGGAARGVRVNLQNFAAAAPEKTVPSLAGVPGSVSAPSTKTAIIVTPPPLSGAPRAPPPPHTPSAPRRSRPATEPYNPGSASTSVYFPPVVRARSTRTRYARSTRTARTSDSRKSATSLWPGDPRAICSVRRDRRNIDEMLASVKSGQETRRLVRDAKPTCSRNCSKPNIMQLLERSYVNLPDLLPEIEKARQRQGGGAQTDRLPLSSADKRKSVGRFELEEEQLTGSQNLPVYHINYNKLREIGGTRRNSVLV